MNSKNNSGQSPLEVMLALAIAGMVLMPLLSLQTRTVRTVVGRDEHLRRILEAEQFLATQYRLQPEDAKQATVDQKGFRYELRPVGDDSAFKGLADLYREQVTYNWRTENRPQKERALYFLFRPEKIKE